MKGALGKHRFSSEGFQGRALPPFVVMDLNNSEPPFLLPLAVEKL